MRISLWLLTGAIVLSWTLAAHADDQKYIGNTACKVCHNKKTEGAQWDVWHASKHAQAYATLSTDKAKEVAAKVGLKTPPNESPECLQCHVSGYDVATKSFNPKLKKEDGVQCESCHGPSSLHQKDGMLALQKKQVDIKAHRKTVTSEDCEKCHNPKNPTWNPELYTTKDGKKTGFDPQQAFKKIEHYNPTKKHEPFK